MLVGEGGEVGAAAGFVEAGGAYDDELLRLAQALGVDGGLAADHADGGELGDLVGQGHELGNGAKGLVGKGGVEASHEDPFAEGYEFERERDNSRGEELHLVDADDFDDVELGEEVRAEIFYGRDDGRVVGLGAVGGDRSAVVAKVDVRFVAGDALAGDAGALEAADEFFGLTGKHGASDDFENAGGGAWVHGLGYFRERTVVILRRSRQCIKG